MKLSVKLFVLAALFLVLPVFSRAQEGPLDKAEPKGISVDEIIQRFAAKEKQFKEARDQYTYRQSVKVETLDGDTVDGTWEQVTDITFDDKGRRQESVVFAPQPTLTRISMTKEDVDDIEHRLPFVLTSDELPEYQIMYVGQQQEDELHTYVFDVAPKTIDKNKRYFQGRIWVDDHDFQIVKTHGKNVPDIRSKSGENLFPDFTTWREQVDGRYWFPTYTLIDDTLHFKQNDVHVKEIIKYTNYKRFGSNVKITYEGQDIKKGDEQQAQQQPGQQPPATQPPATQPPQTPPPAAKPPAVKPPKN